MPTFNEIQEHFQELIRKGLEGSFFVKRHDSADTPITALKDAAGLLELPPGYTDVGLLTKEQGLSWTRDITSSDTNSLGYSEPTRRDVTGDVTGLQFTAQESKLQVFELYDGVDLTGVTADAAGNVYWDKPDRPASLHYRGLALFKDGDGADAIYFGSWLPRFQVTDRGEQSWNETNEVLYPMTVTAFTDSVVGTSKRQLWAGSAETLAKMGFPTGTTAA